MAQKRFVFDDEKETVQTQQSLSQIDMKTINTQKKKRLLIKKKQFQKYLKILFPLSIQ